MQRLTDEAWRDLGESRYDAALAKAQTLRSNRFSTCDLVAAHAWVGKGSVEKAVQILAAAPSDIFSNQIYLGTLLTQLGRYGDALLTFDQAALCADPDLGELAYDRAECLRKAGRKKEALSFCRVPESGPFREWIGRLRAELLVDLGRYREAETLARELLPEAKNERPSLLQALCICELKAGRRDQACKDAIEALRSAAQFEGAAKVIRLCERCDGQRFWIMVKGRWDKPEEGSKRPPGFFRSYQIAAPNLQAAIELARAQEPPAVRASVALEEVKKFGPFPTKYGILFRSGRAFFPEP